MTREEAIQELKKGIPRSWEWGRDFGTFENAIDIVVKALERETSILDKIRAEIDGAKLPKNRMCFFRDGIECALQIIDKYRMESEE